MSRPYYIQSRREVSTHSWWADPAVQHDRAKFDAAADVEFQQRIRFSKVAVVSRDELKLKDEP